MFSCCGLDTEVVGRLSDELVTFEDRDELLRKGRLGGLVVAIKSDDVDLSAARSDEVGLLTVGLLHIQRAARHIIELDGGNHTKLELGLLAVGGFH